MPSEPLNINPAGSPSDFVLYSTPNGGVHVETFVRGESLWLTQKSMATLFDVKVPAIAKHLKNIFAEGELQEQVVISKMETTTPHGAIEGKTQTRATNYYNLDAIISVGYRVNTQKATHFRIWATGVLREYIVKGFAMDDARLKQGSTRHLTKPRRSNPILIRSSSS